MVSPVIRAIGRLIVPSSIRPSVRRLWVKWKYAGNVFQCSCCGSRLRRFLPHGQPPETNFLCPVCRSKPPHRLAALLFDNHPEWFRQNGLLVHIAPEDELRRKLMRLARMQQMEYRCGGITGHGDEYLDIFRLPFDDGSVDFLYCCHVLNMVENDLAAMREVFRVMRPGGIALLQVPAFYYGAMSLESFDTQDRIAKFRDPLMYRCYSDPDYVSRLMAAGFRVERFLASQFPPTLVARHELKQEVLHACFKSESTCL